MSDQVLITSSKLVSLANSVRSHASLSDLLKLPDIPGLIGRSLALEPGTYDINNRLLKSWEQLLTDGDVEEYGNGTELATPADRVDRFNGVSKIIIPDNIISISSSAFDGCDNIHGIVYNGNATGGPWGAGKGYAVKLPSSSFDAIYTANGKLIMDDSKIGYRGTDPYKQDGFGYIYSAWKQPDGKFYSVLVYPKDASVAYSSWYVYDVETHEIGNTSIFQIGSPMWPNPPIQAFDEDAVCTYYSNFETDYTGKCFTAH